ncbi:hypothetical protein [Elizabethkingia meningoseptica]|uniref:hypothetical protein n=1 Tax=Elizabethkingia meningoseptica TaxID=238 RepID=UPI0038921603
MKLNFSLIITLFTFFSQYAFAQNNIQNLANTYWKVTTHYGNADTWTFVPLKEKPKPDAEFDFLEFDKKNNYHFHMDVSSSCKVNLSGAYHIEKSHITFSTKQAAIDKGCKGLNDFRLGTMAIIMKNDQLYLTQPTPWYDEKITKKADTIQIRAEQLGRIETNEEGKYYVTDANRIPFDDGTYCVSIEKDPNAKFVFTSKNGLLDGVTFSKAKDAEIRYLYKDGKMLNEKRWKSKQLIFDKTNLEDIKKDTAGNYIITLTEVKQNLNRSRRDSTVTVFLNTKPITKVRYEGNKLVTQKDFQKDTFRKYSADGKLLESEDPGIHIEYDIDGKEKIKKLYTSGTYELYKYGVLREKKIYSGNKVTVTTYDERQNLIEKKIENISVLAEIADMDKYENELSDKKFNDYKKAAN